MKLYNYIKEQLTNHNTYIANLDEFTSHAMIKISLEEVDEEERALCYQTILEFNETMINKFSLENSKLKEKINGSRPISESRNECPLHIENSSFLVNPENHNDYSYLNNLIESVKTEEEILSFISSLTNEEILYVKLYLHKRINEVKQQLREKIILNPLDNISCKQEDLNRYELISLYIQDLDAIEKSDELEENESKVILLPSNKNTSWLYEDILKHQDNLKEIKTVVDKVLEGYFLQSKHIKSIVGKQVKLHEYTSKTGLRIMFISLGNTQVICSLFYKDKQKSTKIEAYYDEAITRFNNQLERLELNINTPDFSIEQAELIGQINNLFENRLPVSLKKESE